MDFQEVINDDAALHALLDGLDGGVDDIPRACDLDDDPTPEQLQALLHGANDALRDTSDHVPTPDPEGRNTGRVLAAALVAVARLGASARAHGRLRAAAEQRAARLEFDVADGERALKEAQRTARVRAVADRDALGRAREDAARERRAALAAKWAATEARSAATASANRAQVAEAALRRKEKEVGALQKRVHGQLSGAQRPSLAVEVSGEVSGNAKRAGLEEGVESFTKQAVEVERRRWAALEAENTVLREQVHAITLELEAIVHGFPRVVEIERQQQAMVNGEEDVHETAGPALKEVAAREMLLPYEAVVDKVEESVVQKFKMLRRALCYQELVEADMADGLTVIHENGGGGEDDVEADRVVETGADEEVEDEAEGNVDVNRTSSELPGDDEMLSEGLSKSSTSWEDQVRSSGESVSESTR